MKSISQKLQDDIRAIMEANLHPNQQKIDVHEPEKDEITAHDFKKLRAMKKTPDGKVHDCATHVEHTELGRGVTISEQHAEPDENGNIEWYAVQFDSGVYKVYTEDMDIIVSEAHHHGGMMKKEDTDDQIQELAGKAAQQAAIAISLIKAGKKKGTMPKPMRETSELEETKGAPKGHHFTKGGQLKRGDADQDGHGGPMLRTDPKDKMRNKIPPVTEEDKKVVSPFDYKNYKSEIPKKPGELTGHDSKKISTGTVYTKKPVKEEASKESKKDFQDRQQRLAAAGAETAKDPARLKRMSNIPGYSAAMDLAKKTTKEEVEQEEYTFADYLDAVRAQYGDEDAVLIANEAFKNKDITLFIDRSQSPEA